MKNSSGRLSHQAQETYKSAQKNLVRAFYKKLGRPCEIHNGYRKVTDGGIIKINDCYQVGFRISGGELVEVIEFKTGGHEPYMHLTPIFRWVNGQMVYKSVWSLKKL